MKKPVKKISIEFTKKQFLALMKTVYLGNWMANAYRIEDIQEDYKKIENQIFSYAPQFGFDKYMDHESTDGDKYYPTMHFEVSTDVHDLHEEYDENTFWDELSERLGYRDFIEHYSSQEIKAMSREEYYNKMQEFVDIYNAELETHGIDRIRIVKNNFNKLRN